MSIFYKSLKQLYNIVTHTFKNYQTKHVQIANSSDIIIKVV